MSHLESPGGFHTLSDGWTAHKDPLSFAADASTHKGDTTERAMAWLKKHGANRTKPVRLKGRTARAH